MRKLIVLFFLCFCLVSASSAEASVKQKRQNRIANKYKLSRLKNIVQLEKFIKNGWLVSVSDTDAYRLDRKLGKWDKKNKKSYRHARPYVKDFLDTELTKCYKETGEVFKVNSLVRTVVYQRLMRKKGDGAIIGKIWWKQSLHLTGAAVDISYGGGVTAAGRSCLRKRLRELEKDDRVITIYESDHFHIFVSPKYNE